MMEQTTQILHVRRLRRDILLSRIERTRIRVADTAADLGSADAERLNIQQFQEQRARNLRRNTQVELQGLKMRKQLEAEALLLKLEGDQSLLAQEQMDLRRTEAKLDALQRYADDVLASVDDADDD